MDSISAISKNAFLEPTSSLAPFISNPLPLCCEETLQLDVVVHRDSKGEVGQFPVQVLLIEREESKEGIVQGGKILYSQAVGNKEVQAKGEGGKDMYGQGKGGRKIHIILGETKKMHGQGRGGRELSGKDSRCRKIHSYGAGSRNLGIHKVGSRKMHCQGKTGKEMHITAGGSKEATDQSWWRKLGGRRRGGIVLVVNETSNNNGNEVQMNNDQMNEAYMNKMKEHPVSEKETPQEETMYESEDENMNTIEESIFECKKCEKVCPDKKSLKWHTQNVHSCIVHKCVICENTFSNQFNLKRHVQVVHEKKKSKLCHGCGKMYDQIRDLRSHESTCTGSPNMKANRIKNCECHYCNKKLSTKSKLKDHIRKKHEQPDLSEESSRRKLDLECAVCSKRLKSSRNMKHHMETIHKICNEPQSEEDCPECEMKFESKSMLNEHLIVIHNKELQYPCLLCTKSYKSRKVLSDHYSKDHSKESYKCLTCEKTFKRKSNLRVHTKRHLNPPRQKKPLETVSRSAYNKRRRQTEKIISDQLKQFPELTRKTIVKNILKENPCLVNDMDPLTEDEVLDMIKDLSISDRVMLQILQNMRKKWGRKIVTPNIRNCLRDRKLLVDEFFTLVTLDETTDYNFTDSQGNIVSRQLTYCHDIEGLLIFKEILEVEKHGLDIAKDIDQVIGLDGGVKKLIMSHTWCPKEANGQRRKLSQKNTIILAAVAEIPENNHNLRTLFALTQVNKLSYLLSSDLKLWLLALGLGNNSSTYSCGLGECRKISKRGKWIKGPNRTISTICEERRKWLLETGGNRKKLNKYMNCEHEPVARPQHDENAPIFPWSQGYN